MDFTGYDSIGVFPVKKICVIGSLNIDLTIRLPRFHAPGETITGEAFDTYAGGKGGNQAVAAARLGTDVLMVGKLGEDSNGAFYRKAMEDNRVDASGVEAARGVPSGVALIEVDARGENRIAVVQGANALVDTAQIDRLMPKLLLYDIFLFQLEIPLDTVIYAAERLHRHGKLIIIDPAPAMPLPDSLLSSVDYITPNEGELALLTGLPTGSYDQVIEASRQLTARGARAVLAKMGARGAAYIDVSADFASPGIKVAAVDTTAAGDSFNAGFAVALANDMPIREAMRFANCVGALSTQGAGAQQAMPAMAQVREFLGNQ